MTLQRIEKISNLTVKDFYENYFLLHKPVIIKDLFKSQPITDFADEKKIAEIFHDTKLEVVEEYIDKFVKDNSFMKEPLLWSFKDYMDFIKTNPGTNLCVREFETPDKIMKLFSIPEYCNINQFDKIFSHMFLANSGNVSRLHFDGDYNHVLLHQIFGRKRIILFPAIEAKKLAPVLNISWILLDKFSERDKYNFISYANGYDFILNPGDTIYIPMMMWHHIEYIDIGLSINLRFGRNKYTTFLEDKVHLDMYIQNIATKIDKLDKNNTEYLKFFKQIEDAIKINFNSSLSKYQHMKELFKEIYKELCQDAIQSDYFILNNESLVENNSAFLSLFEDYYPCN